MQYFISLLTSVNLNAVLQKSFHIDSRVKDILTRFKCIMSKDIINILDPRQVTARFSFLL